MKRSAKLRQRLARTKWNSGVIGVADRDGLVWLDESTAVPLPVLEAAAREYAQRVGGSVSYDGARTLVFCMPPEAQPPVAVEHTGDPGAFEGHPFFHSRVRVGSYHGFVVMGPEEPQIGATAIGIIGRRCALFVERPFAPESQRWYRRSWLLEYFTENTDTRTAAIFAEQIRHEVRAAEVTLVEMSTSPLDEGLSCE